MNKWLCLRPTSAKKMTAKDTFFECMTLDELEKWAIETAMDRNNENVRAVARELGVGKTTIYRKVEKYSRERGKKP